MTLDHKLLESIAPGRKPLVEDGRTLVVRAHVNGHTGYSQHVLEFGRAIEKLGYGVRVDPVDISDGLIPIPEWFKVHL